MLAKPSLTLKRRLKATPAQVFSAWTDPQKIVHWFGPRDTVAGSVKADMDVRAGGRYTMRFTTDNGESHKVGGVYREVAPPNRLVFSWAWQSTPERESLVTVTVAPDGADGSILTLHHEQFFDDAARNGHERGWTGTLEKLEAYFA
jgi:uncharacterized protein YndB with AHSA1/START domain